MKFRKQEFLLNSPFIQRFVTDQFVLQAKLQNGILFQLQLSLRLIKVFALNKTVPFYKRNIPKDRKEKRIRHVEKK